VQVPYPSTFRADRLVVPLMGPPNRKDLPLYSPIVRFIHDFVASAVVPDYTKEPWSGTGTRLFVLRGAAKHRCVINESEIAQALEAEGWRIIDPATLSFEQQIAAFNTASHVAASHGAGLANLAFCRPGTEVIELAFPRWSPTYFEAVSLGRDLRHHTLQMQEIQSLQRLAKLNDGFISPALSRRIIQFGAE
jgi:capsular polysaccharide biosynthesis protein